MSKNQNSEFRSQNSQEERLYLRWGASDLCCFSQPSRGLIQSVSTAVGTKTSDLH